MRVGLIGCGNIAVNGHAPSIKQLENIEIVGVADPVAENRQKVLAVLDTPTVKAFDSHQALLDAGVDMVGVTVPPKFRRAIVEDCAKAGVHVLSEKPLSTIPAEGQAMIDAMKAANLQFGMMHNYRYFPRFALARKLIDEGAIGQLRHVTLQWLGMYDWPGSADYKPRWRHDVNESVGGILMDMLHAFYMAAWYIGPIYAVSAVVDNLNNASGNVEDFSIIHLYGQKVYATINMWWGRGPNGVEFSGTGGQIRYFGGDYYCPDAAEPFTLFNDEGRQTFDLDDNYPSSFSSVYHNFIDALNNQADLIGPAEAGLAALEATLGAYISTATGQTVSLPLPKDHPVYQAGVGALRQLELWPDSPIVRRGVFGI